jgi:transglutaminase-like putative cysteine protease
MKILVLLFSVLVFPLREVVDVQLYIPTHQHDIFFNYANDNFSQVISQKGPQKIIAYIKADNYFSLNLDFKISPQETYISSLPPKLRENTLTLLEDCSTFKAYFTNISLFLQGNITYTEHPLNQDAESVVTAKKADCVGFANLVQVYLEAVGIKNRQVKGFYLKNSPGASEVLVPVPHRWTEIFLPNGAKFFFDPQRQRFSAEYITIKDGVDFKEVKKFKVNLVKKSKKIVN